VYLGWITVASIANITVLLVDMNWAALGLGQQFWTVAVIVVVLAITLAILFLRRDIFYAIVVDWALLGILLKRLSVETLPDADVVSASIVGLIIVTTGIIIQLTRKEAYHMRQGKLRS
jgi:hypothetical protein